MRVSIVEDNPDLLEKLTLILAGEEECEVVGNYETAEAALQHIPASPPDIMLVDITLPGISGIELIEKIKADFPLIDIIVLTGDERRETILGAIRAGATGYLLKGLTPRELIEGLQEMCKGGVPMSPKIARVILHEVRKDGNEDLFLLSRREKEILKEIYDGMSYKEISKSLNISTHTVHSHIKNIYDKLQASGRKDALQKAVKKGLI